MSNEYEANDRCLAPALARWCRHAEPGERTTAIIRTRVSANVDEMADALRAEGAEVQSAGKGATTVVATSDELRRISNLPDIVTIDAPRELSPKSSFPR